MIFEAAIAASRSIFLSCDLSSQMRIGFAAVSIARGEAAIFHCDDDRLFGVERGMDGSYVASLSPEPAKRQLQTTRAKHGECRVAEIQS